MLLFKLILIRALDKKRGEELQFGVRGLRNAVLYILHIYTPNCFIIHTLVCKFNKPQVLLIHGLFHVSKQAEKLHVRFTSMNH
jgi:hypothetical protein